jgi:hypothetical protein
MYQNVFMPVQNLRRPAKIKPGGLCKFYFCKHEDVAYWPKQDPTTGVLYEPLQLKVGGTFYIIESPQKDRSYKEKQVRGPEGTLIETTVTCLLPGNTKNNILSIDAMDYHKYVIITEDKDGIQRLIGNEDACATFIWDFDGGDNSSSRERNLKFVWQHSLSAPIYEGGGLITDITQIFTQLTKIDEFKVEDGAPMEDGDTDYQNVLLTGRNFVMFADGILIPQLVNPGFRYCRKVPISSDTIIVNGGVTEPEIISIFLIS